MIVGRTPPSVESDAFAKCKNIKRIYFKGTASEWGRVRPSYAEIATATVYFYVEQQSDVPTDGGKYWHYVFGVPTIWEV